MNNTFKSIISTAIAIVLTLGFTNFAFADNFETNKFIDEKQKIFKPIIEQIYNDYGELYDFKNFEFKTYNFAKGDNNYIGIDVFVDMTLTRHPEDNLYFKGELDALKKINNNDSLKSFLEKEISERIRDIENEYYQVPNRTTFTYAYKLDTLKENKMNLKNDYSIEDYYYIVGDEEKTLLEADKLNKIEDKSVSYEKGYKELLNSTKEILLDKNRMTSFRGNTSYDRIKARDWALDNALKEQEYPSKEVQGTDCANFVSKSLRAGGIPEDKPGEWYGSSYWGGWSGKNWLRTGNGTDGGVVPYMTNRGYFALESNESSVSAGCIMNWLNTSHVALVTYGDGTTIKYTQHGAHPSKDTVYRSSDVKAEFYKYQ